MVKPIADWRDANKYMFPIETSMKRWAVEFLRRNHEYQTDVEKYLAACNAIVNSFNPFNPPDTNDQEVARLYSLLEDDERYRVYTPSRLEGETEDAWAVRVGQGKSTDLCCWYAKKWGLDGSIFDPFAPCPWQGVSFETSPSARTIGPGWGEGVDMFATHYEAAYLIDYRRPILPQIEAIKVRASSHQRWLKENGHIASLPNKRDRSTLYPIYLRCLDADDAGATAADIATQLCPEKDTTKATGYRGHATVMDWMRAAKVLRDTDYQYLAAMQPWNKKRPK